LRGILTTYDLLSYDARNSFSGGGDGECDAVQQQQQLSVRYLKIWRYWLSAVLTYTIQPPARQQGQQTQVDPGFAAQLCRVQSF
jgi:hypothetical protein